MPHSTDSSTVVAPNRRQFLRSTIGGAAVLLGTRCVRSSETAPSATDVALQEPMRRAAACCLAWLDPAQRHLPTGGYEAAHDTGRWFDAMLRAEAVGAASVPGDVEAAMIQNLQMLTANPAALLHLTPETGRPAEQCFVNPHNLRESMLAYHALVRYRQSDWAASQGHRLLETIAGLIEPDGQMDYARLATVAGGPLSTDPLMIQRAPAGQWFDATATTGRALEAIVWFHESTGDPLAREVAQRVAEIHRRVTLHPEGIVRPELRDAAHVGHNHSYLGTLRGLLLFGLAEGDRALVDDVARTYRRGLWGAVISHSGWTPHDLGTVRFPDAGGDPVGEHASCGDVAQLALWLALRAGHAELLDDVQRLVRARLLPSQIDDPGNPRQHGAWGVYGDGFGRGAILDVFAAVLHTLTDAESNIVAADGDGTITVHLHFSADTPRANVRAERGEVGRLCVVPKHSEGRPGQSPNLRGDLRLRVPGWAPRETVRLTAAGRSLPLAWDGSYLCIAPADAPPGTEIVLAYDLPRRETEEVLPVSRRAFRLTWRGDTVASCDPSVPIYPM